MLRCFRALRVRLIWFFFHLLPIDSSKIVVSNFYGRGYGDNPKYITEKLLSSPYKLRIIWLIKTPYEKSTLPEGVEACQIDTIMSIYHLMTAKIWIDNCRKHFIKFKRKKQYYIQTWHGFALKRIEKDAADKLSKDYVKSAIRDSKNIDYIISCSSFMSKLYRSSFWYDGSILEFGAPRNDILLKPDESLIHKVHNYFGIDSNKHIILYAPTFRADKNMRAYNIDYIRLIRSCEKRFGVTFIVIAKLHPNIASQSKALPCNSLIIDGTHYPDMQELMCASDVIVTDYSSVMFDFSIANKPCFQYAVDIEDYKNDRNFYFPLDQLPFPLASNNDELEHCVLNFDSVEYENKLNNFYNSNGLNRTGNASERCADLILSLTGKGK